MQRCHELPMGHPCHPGWSCRGLVREDTGIRAGWQAGGVILPCRFCMEHSPDGLYGRPKRFVNTGPTAGLIRRRIETDADSNATPVASAPGWRPFQLKGLACRPRQAYEARRMKACRPAWATRRISIRPRQHQPPVSNSTKQSMSNALTTPSPLQSASMMSQSGHAAA